MITPGKHEPWDLVGTRWYTTPGGVKTTLALRPHGPCEKWIRVSLRAWLERDWGEIIPRAEAERYFYFGRSPNA